MGSNPWRIQSFSREHYPFGGWNIVPINYLLGDKLAASHAPLHFRSRDDDGDHLFAVF